MTQSNSKPWASGLVSLAALVIVLAGMRAAAEIVVPFLLMLFIAILCALAVEWLTGKGLERGAAVSVVLAAFVLVELRNDAVRFESMTYTFFLHSFTFKNKVLPELAWGFPYRSP